MSRRLVGLQMVLAEVFLKKQVAMFVQREKSYKIFMCGNEFRFKEIKNNKPERSELNCEH